MVLSKYYTYYTIFTVTDSDIKIHIDDKITYNDRELTKVEQLPVSSYFKQFDNINRFAVTVSVEEKSKELAKERAMDFFRRTISLNKEYVI